MAFATNPKDGRRIYYDVQGRGAPLVLFQGTATSSMLWHELGYVEALPDRRLILIDGRGHGRSDKPRHESAYRMDMLVADVLAVLDQLGIERTDFFGYSLGARLGLALAAAAPHRLYALAIGGGSHQPQRGALDRLIYPGFADTIETDGIDAFLDIWSERVGRTIDPGLRAVFLGNDPTALVAFLRQTHAEEGVPADVLACVELRILLLVGELDHERLNDATVAAAILPNAELATVEGADHFSTLLQRDDIVTSLHRFFQVATTGTHSSMAREGESRPTPARPPPASGARARLSAFDPH
jgi:pimeloyl-ACP methyl ester carboxylesterase